MAEKKYKFRELGSRDLFLMIKLVKKIGLNNFSELLKGDNIKKIVSQFTTDKDEDAESKEAAYMQIGIALGLDFFQVVIERLDECEDVIYEILNKTSNMNLKDLYAMHPDEFIEMIYDFSQLEDFQKLFQKAVSLFKSGK